MLRSIHATNGYNVRAVNGVIGKVKSFLFDDTIWSIRYLVITIPTNDIDGERDTLIAPFSFGFLNSETGELPLSLEKEKVENSPTVDLERPISHQHQIELYKYYKWPPFSKYTIPNDIDSPMLMKIIEEKESDFSEHLFNTEKIIGYDIEATDGKIGYVHDFIIDDEVWHIRYIAIDMGGRMPGKKVLTFPKVIKEFKQDNNKLLINIVKDTLINSPEYNSKFPIERAYEIKLHQYYGFLRYWD
jgi:hypothetical protein